MKSYVEEGCADPTASSWGNTFNPIYENQANCCGAPADRLDPPTPGSYGGCSGNGTCPCVTTNWATSPYGIRTCNPYCNAPNYP